MTSVLRFFWPRRTRRRWRDERVGLCVWNRAHNSASRRVCAAWDCKGRCQESERSSIKSRRVSKKRDSALPAFALGQ